MKEGPRFLFAVVRDVQRNIVMFVRDLDGHEFLFAVVRDVQRNFKQVYTDQLSIRCRARRTAEPSASAPCASSSGFYSLSCETYSGTPDHLTIQ